MYICTYLHRYQTRQRKLRSELVGNYQKPRGDPETGLLNYKDKNIIGRVAAINQQVAAR